MRSAFAVAAALIAAPAAAADHDSQFWATATASAPLGGKFSASVETVLRFGDDADGLYEGEYGINLAYDISKQTAVSVGYLRVPAYSRAGVTSRENRFRQQIGFDIGEIAGGKLTGRVRLEERLRDTGDDLGLRLRPYLKWSLPLAEDGPALVLSHESFVTLNDTDWGQRDGYERMRNFIGFNVPIVTGLKGEFGYLNQYGFGRDDDEDSIDDVASVSFAYSF